MKTFIPVDKANEIAKDYKNTLETDVKYSLEVDPENKYKMSPQKKEFVKQYVQFKNIPLVAQLCGISEKDARTYFLSYDVQQEVRRINLAMYNRQFSNKLLSLDEIGGYLSSVLTDQTAMADRINTKDKLKVAQMIIDINKMKSEAFENPQIIDTIEIQDDLKDLSANDIKALIEQTKKPNLTKKEIIDQLNVDNLFTPEDITYLNSLSVKELLEMKENIDADK